jgi:hypothetical protein
MLEQEGDAAASLHGSVRDRGALSVRGVAVLSDVSLG